MLSMLSSMLHTAVCSKCFVIVVMVCWMVLLLMFLFVGVFKHVQNNFFLKCFLLYEMQIFSTLYKIKSNTQCPPSLLIIFFFFLMYRGFQLMVPLQCVYQIRRTIIFQQYEYQYRSWRVIGYVSVILIMHYNCEKSACDHLIA